MIAVAIQDVNRSYELIREAEEFVLAVPGETLAEDTMHFGFMTSRDVDKVSARPVELTPSETIKVPGILKAIANVELRKVATLTTGDHLLVVGEVLRFAVNTECRELPLLSVGPREAGYQVLARRGIHRIAVVDAPPETEEPSEEDGAEVLP
jgi:flavin reductase (DIM6/NTAB) family NADH-FMN oxidoreductase RutF